MQAILPIVTLFVGAAVGCVAVWLILRGRMDAIRHQVAAQFEVEQATLQERLQNKDNQIAQLDEDLEEASDKLGKAQELLKEESDQRSAAETEAKRVPKLEEQIGELQEETRAQAKTLSELETRIEDERVAVEEKLALVREAEAKLSDAFKALSAEALKSNNASFLELAKTTLEKFQESARTDLEGRQKAIGDLVVPVQESLAGVHEQIQSLEKARIQAYTELKGQVGSLLQTETQLQKETANLVKALRTPNVRGRWGEVQLQRVVEIAGMVEYCDFVQQASTTTEEGRLRPDMIIRLPNQRNVVVDSKVPLMSYLDALEAPDEATRAAKLQDHARQVRSHFSKLGSKSYWEQVQPAPEFVVLFLPGESFFSAALEQDPTLIEAGVKQNVILATPTTLIALLKAIAYGWQQEKIAESAEAISQLGRELYERLCVLGDHIGGIGKSLDRAVEAYNKAVGSLESRVLVSARKFPELGIPKAKELTELVPVEKTARELTAADVVH